MYKSINGNEETIHRDIVSQCKKGIVELGVLFGATTRIFCIANSNIPIYGIDPIIPDSMNASLIGNEERIKDNTKDFTNFTLIKDYSFNVVKNWDKPFDYVFIDASHIYKDVKKDFEEWFSKLEPGGYVGLHDSAADRGGPYNWPGPSQLARELIDDDRVEYIITVNSLTIFKKIL